MHKAFSLLPIKKKKKASSQLVHQYSERSFHQIPNWRFIPNQTSHNLKMFSIGKPLNFYQKVILELAQLLFCKCIHELIVFRPLFS